MKKDEPIRRKSISISTNMKQVVKELKNLGKLSEKVVSRTVSDMKSRAPGAVASAVTTTYNIKKTEITPVSKTSSKQVKKAAAVRVTGEQISDLAIVYEGRPLTPIHFRMTPTAPIPGKKYDIKFEVKKGRKQILHGKDDLGQPPFLASNGYGAYIPFQRKADSREIAYSVRTTSVPQMIQDESSVEAEIQRRLDELLSKRLDYHMSRMKNGGAK